MGVTTILSKTKSLRDMLVLERWKRKMIKEMGQVAFEQMQKETLEQGRELHEAISLVLSGEKSRDRVEVSENTAGLWRSVRPVLDQLTDVRMIEQELKHEQLGYRGYVDCVAEYKGELCVIDWKTSKKPRYSLKDCYDDPIQISAYAGAYNSGKEIEKPITKGLVVKVYYSGKPASTFQMNDFNMEYHWNKWLTRITDYYFKERVELD